MLGTLIAAGAITAGAAMGGGWATDLAGQVTVGAAPSAIGPALAVSSRLSALWRRRLRLVLLATAVMLVAYSGQLSDVLLLSAGLVGLAAGPLLLGRPARTPGPASRTEARVLVAMVVAVSAVGPLVAAIAQSPIGPLSVLQFVVLSPPPTPPPSRRSAPEPPTRTVVSCRRSCGCPGSGLRSPRRYRCCCWWWSPKGCAGDGEPHGRSVSR